MLMLGYCNQEVNTLHLLDDVDFTLGDRMIQLHSTGGLM